MRRCRPPKQRVWLGPDRYICGCERRITHANAYSDSNSYSYGYGHGYCYSDGHSYSYSNAKADAHAEICTNSETSSHTAAETVGIFAGAKIFAIGDR
jgi:hypothetical protein